MQQIKTAAENNMISELKNLVRNIEDERLLSHLNNLIKTFDMPAILELIGSKDNVNANTFA